MFAGMAPSLPEDLYHLIKKAVSVRKHLERNRKVCIFVKIIKYIVAMFRHSEILKIMSTEYIFILVSYDVCDVMHPHRAS
jgi:hypothetical protein